MKKILLAMIIIILIGSGVGVYVGLSYSTNHATGQSYCDSNVTSSQVTWYSSTSSGNAIVQKNALFIMEDNSSATICVQYGLVPNSGASRPILHLFPVFTYVRQGPPGKNGSWSNSSGLFTSSNPATYTFKEPRDSVVVSYSIHAPNNSTGYYLLFLSGFCPSFAYLMVGITPSGNDTLPFTTANFPTASGNCANQEFSSTVVGISGLSVTSLTVPAG